MGKYSKYMNKNNIRENETGKKKEHTLFSLEIKIIAKLHIT